MDGHCGRQCNCARSAASGVPESLKVLEEFHARRGRPEIEQAFDAVGSQLIRVAADRSFRKGDVFPRKCEVHIQVNDLRNMHPVACLKRVVKAGESVEFLLLDFRRPTGPGIIEIALKPDVKKGESAIPEIEDSKTSGDKIGLGDFHGKHSLVDVPTTTVEGV